jgi:tetratricopeptide (TPR) repeat protein
MAADEFRKELAQIPGSALAMSMLALALNYDRKPKEALAQAEAAIAADPERAFAHYALACVTIGPSTRFQKVKSFHLDWSAGRALAQRWRLRKAIRPLMEAIRLDPRNPDFLALMSAIKLDQVQPRQSLEWADKALACRPDHQYAMNVRARALAKLGRAYDAKQTIQSALALNPESAAAHAHGGWTHLQVGDPKKAVEHFQQSVRLDPNNAAAHRGLQMARLSSRLGRKLSLPILLAFVVLQLLRLAFLTAPGYEPHVSAAVRTTTVILDCAVVLIIVRICYRRFWRQKRG